MPPPHVGMITGSVKRCEPPQYCGGSRGGRGVSWDVEAAHSQLLYGQLSRNPYPGQVTQNLALTRVLSFPLGLSLSLIWCLDLWRSSRLEKDSELCWTHCNAAPSVTQKLKQYSVSSLGGPLNHLRANMCAGPWRHHFLHTTMNLVLLSCFILRHWSTWLNHCGVFYFPPRTNFQPFPGKAKQKEKKTTLPLFSAKHSERLFFWSEAHSSQLSVL